MEVVDGDPELFGEVEVVRRQLVLGIVAIADVLHLPHEMQPLRFGPTPPKYGSSASTPGLPKWTPIGALLKVCSRPISPATCFMTRSTSVGPCTA